MFWHIDATCSKEKVDRVLRYTFFKWLLNTKNITVIVLLLFINNTIIRKMKEVYGIFAEPFCLVESGIALANSGLILSFVFLFFVLLVSDIPCIDDSVYSQIIRGGRKKWIIAQMMTAMIAVIMYNLLLFMFVLVSTSGISYFANGWSVNVSDFGEKTNMLSLLPLKLFNQMSPYKAFALSIVLLVLFEILYVNISILGAAYGKKRITLIIQLFLLIVGMCLINFRKKAMWCFTVAHSILSIHYDDYLRRPVMNPLVSIMIFVTMDIISGLLVFKQLAKVNIDMLKG